MSQDTLSSRTVQPTSVVQNFLPQVGALEFILRWAVGNKQRRSMGGRIKAVDLEIQAYGLWACFLWKSESSRISLKEMKKSVVLLSSSHFLFLLYQFFLFWRLYIYSIYHKLLFLSGSAGRHLKVTLG